jgi:hypothetical protein
MENSACPGRQRLAHGGQIVVTAGPAALAAVGVLPRRSRRRRRVRRISDGQPTTAAVPFYVQGGCKWVREARRICEQRPPVRPVTRLLQVGLRYNAVENEAPLRE